MRPRAQIFFVLHPSHHLSPENKHLTCMGHGAMDTLLLSLFLNRSGLSNEKVSHSYYMCMYMCIADFCWLIR